MYRCVSMESRSFKKKKGTDTESICANEKTRWIVEALGSSSTSWCPLAPVLPFLKCWRGKRNEGRNMKHWVFFISEHISQIVLLHAVLVKQKQKKKLAFAKLIFFLDQHLHIQSRCPDSCVCVWMVEVVFVSMWMIGAVPLLGGFAPFCQKLVLVWTSRGLSYVMFLVFLLRVTPADIVNQNRKAHRHRYSRRELWATRKHVYIYIYTLIILNTFKDILILICVHMRMFLFFFFLFLMLLLIVVSTLPTFSLA